MFNIKNLYTVLPIVYDNKYLQLVSFDDIDWYVNNCRENYYEEYLDFKFSKDISVDKLKEALYNIIISYKLKMEVYGEARLLLKDLNTDEIYGGCTIFERNNNKDIELAYFVLPSYSNRGIATSMIENTIKALLKSNIDFKKIVITIREDNIASIRVVKKLKFKELSRVKGKYKTNIIFYKDKKDI